MDLSGAVLGPAAAGGPGARPAEHGRGGGRRVDQRHVTAATTGLPIEGVGVCAIKVGDIHCDSTDADGKYTITGLEAGDWEVDFDPEGTEFLGEFYDGKSVSSAADPVVLGASTHAEGIDAALSTGGTISGVVTAAQTGESLAGIEVCLVPSPAIGSPRCTETGADGSYEFESLKSGSYKVAFSPEGEEIWGAQVRQAEEETGGVFSRPDGYVTLWWQSGASLSSASPIVVTAPQTVSRVDGAISSTEFWILLRQRNEIPAAIPPAPVTWEPNSPLTPPATTKPIIATKRPKPLECKRGFVKRKAQGKERCVERRKVVHHARKKHRKHAA